MQKVTLSDRGDHHTFEIASVESRDSGYVVKARNLGDVNGHSFLIREEVGRVYTVSHASGPEVRVRLQRDQTREMIRAALASNDDVSGHAIDERVLTGTIESDDDVEGHINLKEAAAAAAFAATTGYVLLTQLASSPAAAHVPMAWRCPGC